MAERKWVVPSKSEHWLRVDEDESEADEDGVEVHGGQAYAFYDRNSQVALHLEYGLCQGFWLGKVELLTNMEFVVWQMAPSLYEEGTMSELQAHYNEAVAPLSDDEFLVALAEYDAGADDFAADYAYVLSPDDWVGDYTFCVVADTMEETEVQGRLESMARAYILNNNL